MPDTALTPVEAKTMEQVVIGGDLEQLSPKERVAYYRRVCESLGLNPFTKPFQYIRLNGKLTLYASKDCTEQLRAAKGISILSLEHETVGEIHFVVASATDSHGRHDTATGAVPLGSLEGEALANAYMKAETKAKRRVTLSLAGLGWLDESEVSSIRSATPMEVDTETGEVSPQQDPIRPIAVSSPHPRIEDGRRGCECGDDWLPCEWCAECDRCINCCEGNGACRLLEPQDDSTATESDEVNPDA